MMATTKRAVRASTRQQARRTRRQRIIRITLFTVLGVLAAVGVIAFNQYQALVQDARNQVVEVGATYTLVPSLAALTKQSDLVIVGRVVGNGSTHLIAQPTTQNGASANAGMGPVPLDKANLATTQQAPTSQQSNSPLPDQSIPETSYTIQIVQVISGTAPASSRIRVNLPGGLVTLPTFPMGPRLQRTMVWENNPLFVAGEQETLFLHRNADGSYAVVGGPQGRFTIVNGAVHPIDAAAPLAKGHDGESLNAFSHDIAVTR
jgi:hypothetical protein